MQLTCGVALALLVVGWAVGFLMGLRAGRHKEVPF